MNDLTNLNATCHQTRGHSDCSYPINASLRYRAKGSCSFTHKDTGGVNFVYYFGDLTVKGLVAQVSCPGCPIPGRISRRAFKFGVTTKFVQFGKMLFNPQWPSLLMRTRGALANCSGVPNAVLSSCPDSFLTLLTASSTVLIPSSYPGHWC